MRSLCIIPFLFCAAAWAGPTPPPPPPRITVIPPRPPIVTVRPPQAAVPAPRPSVPAAKPVDVKPVPASVRSFSHNGATHTAFYQNNMLMWVTTMMLINGHSVEKKVDCNMPVGDYEKKLCDEARKH